MAGAEFALDFLAGEKKVHAPGSAQLGSMYPGDDSITTSFAIPPRWLPKAHAA